MSTGKWMYSTPPKFNIAREKRWLEDDFSDGKILGGV